MVFEFLRERICRASKATDAHKHCEILALNVRCANIPSVGVTLDFLLHSPTAFARAIFAFRAFNTHFSIDFDQHGVINVPAEHSINCFQIRPVTVRSDLDAVAEAGGEVGNKVASRLRAAVPDAP